MTQTVEETRTSGTETPEDMSHMISCPDDFPTTAEWLEHARANGLEVTAICGHVFVPTRNPKAFRVCTACTTEAGNRMFGGGN